MTDAYLYRLTLIVCLLCLTFAFTSMCSMLCILWRARDLYEIKTPDACSVDRDADPIHSDCDSLCHSLCDPEDGSVAIYVR
jgi:hypothetical protein